VKEDEMGNIFSTNGGEEYAHRIVVGMKETTGKIKT
jgi:hypothetical protein